MSKNDTNLLNMICNDYLKSESFKSHINKISEPILKNLLNELGIYLYIFILYVFIISSEALSVNYTWSVFIEFLFGDPHRLKLLDE